MKKETNNFVKLFSKKKKTIALAESITCGLAAHQLSTVKGTSEVLMGAVVCYHPDVKTGLLGIRKKLIKKHSAESMQVTDALAEKLSRVIKADVYGAVTGIASAGGSESENPVGTVFISVYDGKKTMHRKLLFRGSPLTIKKKACLALYELMTKAISKK